MKKLLNIGFCGALVGTLISGIALAADHDAPEKEQTRERAQRGERGERPSPEERFAAMDANEDGKISKKEFKAAHEKRMAAMKERRGDRELPEGRTPPTAKEVFQRLDADSDGFLTKEELQAARQGRMGAQQRGPRGPRGGGGQGGGGGGPQ